MTPQIFPYSTPEGIRELVPLEAFVDIKETLRRLHLAVTARMSASEPTDQERLELLRAWEEAGKKLDAIPVRPNAAECGQCADKTTFHLAPGEG